MKLVMFNAGFFSIFFQLRFLYVVCNFMKHTVLAMIMTMIMAIMIMGKKLTNSAVRVFCEHLLFTRATEK